MDVVSCAVVRDDACGAALEASIFFFQYVDVVFYWEAVSCVVV